MILTIDWKNASIVTVSEYKRRENNDQTLLNFAQFSIIHPLFVNRGRMVLYKNIGTPWWLLCAWWNELYQFSKILLDTQIFINSVPHKSDVCLILYIFWGLLCTRCEHDSDEWYRVICCIYREPWRIINCYFPLAYSCTVFGRWLALFSARLVFIVHMIIYRIKWMGSRDKIQSSIKLRLCEWVSVCRNESKMNDQKLQNRKKWWWYDSSERRRHTDDVIQWWWWWWRWRFCMHDTIWPHNPKCQKRLNKFRFRRYQIEIH